MSRRSLLNLVAGSMTAMGLSACGVRTPKSAGANFGGVGGEGGFRLAWSGNPVDVLTYSPAGLPKDRPVVMSLHGYSRMAAPMMERWRPLADIHGFHVIVPHFDDEYFPGDSYAMGGRDMGVSGQRPIDALSQIFDQAKAHAGLTASEFGLFGHSAGAQLAHRYLMFGDEARVRAAVVSAAGWFTMPDPESRWPYGLAGTPVDLVDLDPLWQKKVLLLVGDSDVGSQDLRWTGEALAQGMTRIARSRSYYNRACKVAAQRGVEIDWQIEMVGDCGHESSKPIERAALFLA